jgi:hypothetical protein
MIEELKNLVKDINIKTPSPYFFRVTSDSEHHVCIWLGKQVIQQTMTRTEGSVPVMILYFSGPPNKALERCKKEDFASNIANVWLERWSTIIQQQLIALDFIARGYFDSNYESEKENYSAFTTIPPQVYMKEGARFTLYTQLMEETKTGCIFESERHLCSQALLLDLEQGQDFRVEFSGIVKGPRISIPMIKLPVKEAVAFIKLHKHTNIYIYIL